MGFFDFFKKKVAPENTLVEKTTKNTTVSQIAENERQYSNYIISILNLYDGDVKPKEKLAAKAKELKLSPKSVFDAEKIALGKSNDITNIKLPGIKESENGLILNAYRKMLLLNISTVENYKRTEIKQLWDQLVRYVPKTDNNTYALLNIVKQFKLDTLFDIQDSLYTVKSENIIYNIEVNNDLPEGDFSNINVIPKKGEILHATAITKLLKQRKKVTRVNYSGFTSSIKIMRGFHYRMGTIKPEREYEKYWNEECDGTFWVSNQRIGFTGEKAFTVPYNKIQSVELTDVGLVIFKEGRENPFVVYFTEQYFPLFNAIISHYLEM